VEKQQARIEALKSALAAQQQILMTIVSANPQKGLMAGRKGSANLSLGLMVNLLGQTYQFW
jgi:hypothetical protein